MALFHWMAIIIVYSLWRGLAARKLMVRKADEPSSWPLKLLLNLVSWKSKGLLTRQNSEIWSLLEWCRQTLSITISGAVNALNPHEQQAIEHIVLSRIHLTIVWRWMTSQQQPVRKHYSVQLSIVSSAAKPMTILIQEIRPHLHDRLPALIVK